MKTQVTIPIFLWSLIVFSTVTLAQISITSVDASAINAVGNVITNYLDSITTTIDIGSPGATSWDFSSLTSNFTTSFTSVNPASAPYYLSNFSNSNVVFSYKVILGADTADGWQYSTQNPGEYLMNGVINKSAIGSDTFLVQAVYSPPQLDLPLPFTFNSQWGSDFTITNTTYFNGNPFITTTANHTETVVVDAWGDMTMPDGAVLPALRVRRDDRYTSPTPPFYVRTISYSFLTKSGAVVEVVASDTTTLNSGIIQTDGVTWSNTHVVGIENKGQIPIQYSFSQSYPNPFNPSTTISFSISTSEFITLKVYDALGHEIATLANEVKPAGSYGIKFDASQLSSGTYFYRIKAGNLFETKKMLLLR